MYVLPRLSIATPVIGVATGVTHVARPRRRSNMSPPSFQRLCPQLKVQVSAWRGEVEHRTCVPPEFCVWLGRKRKEVTYKKKDESEKSQQKTPNLPNLAIVSANTSLSSFHPVHTHFISLYMAPQPSSLAQSNGATGTTTSVLVGQSTQPKHAYYPPYTSIQL